MFKPKLAVLSAALILCGCVYEKEATLTNAPPPPPPSTHAAPPPPPPGPVREYDVERTTPPDQPAYAPVPPRAPRIFVQAGSYLSRAEADRTRRALARYGPTAIYTAYVGDRLRYRVRIGPFASVERGERVRAAIRRRGYRGATIIRD